MKRRYAEGTSVSVERSRAEIETILHRYGCQAFSYGYAGNNARIRFATHDRMIQFDLPLPKKEEFRKREVRGRKVDCTDEQQYALWEAACRQKWRALLLAIKAKLEAVTSGISLFEDEFLAHIVDPVSGDTLGSILRPMLIARYEGKSAGQLCLPGPGSVAGDGET